MYTSVSMNHNDIFLLSRLLPRNVKNWFILNISRGFHAISGYRVSSAKARLSQA
jgi:hypothetical protein